MKYVTTICVKRGLNGNLNQIVQLCVSRPHCSLLLETALKSQMSLISIYMIKRVTMNLEYAMVHKFVHQPGVNGSPGVVVQILVVQVPKKGREVALMKTGF